jgi:methionyl-tRNA formyltransferase
MRVVFFGTPDFAASVLEFLLQNHVEVVAVISKPDRPKGRSGTPVATPVKSVSQAINPNIPVFQPELVSDPAFAETIRAFDADLFVVVAYGEIIKQHLLDMPRLACINVHASLLPKYRGAAPIQRAIMEGEAETGITIMHMVKKMDAGDMIDQVKVTIGPEMTFDELEAALCIVGKQELLKVILEYETNTPKSTPQDISLVTFAPKLELEDCEINWDRPAQQIHDLIRGVNPHPGAWCYVKVQGETKRFKICKTRIIDQKGPAGSILNVASHKGNLVVAAADKSLELLEVQLEGKKKMTSEELMRGISRYEFKINSEGTGTKGT